MVTAIARAEHWRVETYATGQVTATDNVNLAPSGQQQGAVYFTLAPGIRVAGEGARLKLYANYVPTFVFYTNNSASNTIYNNLNATANLEAIEKFFFVDARATISQQFASPFGPQPQNLGTNTSNRYQVATYGISPYFKGVLRGGTTYLLRNDSYWTVPYGANAVNSFYNTTTGLIQNTVARIGWNLEYQGFYLKYSDVSNAVWNRIGRARLFYRVNPQLNTYVVGGYEENNFVGVGGQTESNAVYGGGFTWRPTERTNVVANYEERYFGTSYLVSFDHRTPLTAWTLSASRFASNYPTAAFTLPPGSTAATLDSIFTSRIPDPTARQAAVQQFIQQNALPEFLGAPQSFYTQQIFLQQPIVASFGILGVRNTITFTASRTFFQRLSGATAAPVPDVFRFSSEFVTYLVGVNWSHKLTGITTMNLYGSWVRTNNQQPTVFTSTQELVRLTLNTRLSPKTDGYVGARYTIFHSDAAGSFDYNEAAIFAGITHRFF